MSKVRADQLLVALGLAESRTRAQALILAGTVFAGDRRVAKAGDMLAEDAPAIDRPSAPALRVGDDECPFALHPDQGHLELDIRAELLLDPRPKRIEDGLARLRAGRRHREAARQQQQAKHHLHG